MNIFYYLIISFIVFFIGFSGLFIIRRNVITILMSLELLILSSNFIFMSSSVQFDDFVGQIFTLFILTSAAAESAIGLAVLVSFYRIRGVISLDYVNQLKG